MLSYNENEENYYYNILLHTLAHLFQRGILYNGTEPDRPKLCETKCRKLKMMR